MDTPVEILVTGKMVNAGVRAYERATEYCQSPYAWSLVEEIYVAMEEARVAEAHSRSGQDDSIETK